MAYEHKDNTGTLGRNTKKEKDTHPDSKGKALIGGKWYWISGWTKTGPDGSKFSSLAFTLQDEQKPAPVAAKAADDDGEMPF